MGNEAEKLDQILAAIGVVSRDLSAFRSSAEQRFVGVEERLDAIDARLVIIENKVSDIAAHTLAPVEAAALGQRPRDAGSGPFSIGPLSAKGK